VYLVCGADEPSVLALSDENGMKVIVEIPVSERIIDAQGGPNIMPEVLAGKFTGEKVLTVETVSGCVYLAEIRIKEA
jgi:hypothetical protein